MVSSGFRVGLSPSRAIVPPALVWAEKVGTMRAHELYATILGCSSHPNRELMTYVKKGRSDFT